MRSGRCNHFYCPRMGTDRVLDLSDPWHLAEVTRTRIPESRELLRPLGPESLGERWDVSRSRPTMGRSCARLWVALLWYGPVDTRTPAQRRRIMSAVRQKDTAPESILRRALFAAGIWGWRCHYKKGRDTPDLAWPGRRLAVFVDGAFWHRHPSGHKPVRSGSYWDTKISSSQGSRRRQAACRRRLTVVRFWDFQVQKAVADCVESVRSALASSDLSQPSLA